MTAIADQPLPRPTDRRPTWDIIIDYVDELRGADADAELGVRAHVVPLVLVDMRERDAVGRERYGTPLTSGNGRDHLVDAFQELLDGCVYLASELDEHGVGVATVLSAEVFPDAAHRWYLRDVQQLCVSQIRAAIQLRAVIDERARRTSAVEDAP